MAQYNCKSSSYMYRTLGCYHGANSTMTPLKAGTTRPCGEPGSLTGYKSVSGKPVDDPRTECTKGCAQDCKNIYPSSPDDQQACFYQCIQNCIP